MKKIVTTAFLLGLALIAHPTPAQAVTDPVLFSCQNPVGNVIAKYDSGVHGIPGRSDRFEGSDVVYKIDESYVLQCFCPAEGNQGIQSNWWRADSLTETEREVFVRRGWILVPNGQAWGLVSAPYLVENQSYACAGVGGGNIQSSTQRGQVLGASTLAATGTSAQIALFGLLAISTGLAAWWSARV